ncbi:MAG: T9SS type A sorting domain-containing protein [Saprospiraceae bacterium]|nr:T9SS type A sorting domain-containing protein [Saprospiraceae bacterium]
MTQTTHTGTFLLALLFSIFSIAVQAQKDTEFWFVAPEVSHHNVNLDQPVAFRFSTYGAAAVVTISQPANPAFPTQILNIAANTSGILQLPPLFQFVENTPPNTILNKGFLIESTTPITAYYEVIGDAPNNPELFSLKGKNALGTTFYTTFQNVTTNSPTHTPPPHAAFDIVATEDNTTLTITPSRAIVGHAANIPFNITLNRGQTYSGAAASQLAAQHPTGSKIVADKPIAVTVKDDLLEGGPIYGGFCRDLMGDQLVPIDKLGTRYVVQKGMLNGNEFAFVVATQNATQIKLDGVVAGAINEGEQLNLSITAGGHFVESSAPVYVLQMTGNNCELAGEILPALDCSGSNSVRFVRSTDEPFYLFLTTRSGSEGGFLLNGNAGLIQASDFQVVPGSSGEFVAATIPFSAFEVQTGVSSIVSNNLGLFQMGILNGNGSATGCRFGFFSDFGNKVVSETNIALCPNDSIAIDGQHYSAPATINLTIPGLGDACDTLATYNLTLKPQVSFEEFIFYCPGDTIWIHGQIYGGPGILDLIFPGSGDACDTLAVYYLTLKSQVTINENIALCPGETVSIGGQNYTAPATVNLTLPGLGGDCDTLATYQLSLKTQPSFSQTIEFCPGEIITLGGNEYTQPGTIILTLPAALGCDTIATYILEYLTPAPSNVSIACPANISLITPPGTGPIAINYSDPTAATDCPCPGIALRLTAGPASGTLFPPTTTQVCWQAADSCGQAASCCFLVTVREEAPCDIKNIGCMKYELLSITEDAWENRTYRIKVTNFCNNKMSYTAIQIPDGMTAISPAENSIFTAPNSGREYLVRNPNFSPFYSVRYKTTNDSLFGGASDVLRYTLPAQADVTYIHILSRLEPQVYYEAHMNTFNCPIGVTPPGGGKPAAERVDFEWEVTGIRLFPNPTSGALYADLSAWEGQDLQLRVLDSHGQIVLQQGLTATFDYQSLGLSETLPNGLYFLEIITSEGERQMAQFVRVSP